jgi:hypothetical protein
MQVSRYPLSATSGSRYLSNLLRRVVDGRRHVLHSSSCDEAIQALMLCGNVRDGRIESGRVLYIHLPVMDRAPELAHTLLGLEKVG